MKTTRLGFFGWLFGAAATATAQTITACAPVFGKFLQPCVGQCPACGFAHGEVTADILRNNGRWIPFSAAGIAFACTQCSNIFLRPVTQAVRDETMRSEQ